MHSPFTPGEIVTWAIVAIGFVFRSGQFTASVDYLKKSVDDLKGQIAEHVKRFEKHVEDDERHFEDLAKNVHTLLGRDL